MRGGGWTPDQVVGMVLLIGSIIWLIVATLLEGFRK